MNTPTPLPSHPAVAEFLKRVEQLKQEGDDVGIHGADMFMRNAGAVSFAPYVQRLVERCAELEELLKQGEFWKGIYPDGWTAERVENEMKDYMMLLDGMPELYCHITGGAISKLNTDKQAVMAVSDDHISELCRQAVEEETEHLNSELTALRKERGDLREALTKYGAHTNPNCLGWQGGKSYGPCICGLTEALAHTENQETK